MLNTRGYFGYERWPWKQYTNHLHEITMMTFHEYVLLPDVRLIGATISRKGWWCYVFDSWMQNLRYLHFSSRIPNKTALHDCVAVNQSPAQLRKGPKKSWNVEVINMGPWSALLDQKRNPFLSANPPVLEGFATNWGCLTNTLVSCLSPDVSRWI